MNAWHDKRDGQWLEDAPPRNPAFVDKWLLRQKQIWSRITGPTSSISTIPGCRSGKHGLEAVAHYYNQAIDWHGRPTWCRDRQEARVRSAPRASSRMSSAASSTTFSRSRGRPTPASATGTTTGALYDRRRLQERQAGDPAARPTSCRRTAICCSTSRCAATARSTTRKRPILDEITAWTQRNGEAIFGTRPWRKFGEGPTRPPPSGHAERGPAKPFTARGHALHQRRATTLYAIFLDWPQGESAITSLGSSALPDAVIERVDLIGGPELQFRRDADALRLILPPPADGSFIPALRISGRGLV